jgi:osmotically-inducible protein OsmY
MNKIMISMLSLLLAAGSFACTEDAGIRQSDSSSTGQQDSAQVGDDTVRENQLESDARAREQRSISSGGDPSSGISSGGNNQLGNTDQSGEGVLAIEVRRRLEESLPVNQLTIDENEGAVSISGTVSTQEQLDMIEPLAREVSGVESVETNVVVSPS